MYAFDRKTGKAIVGTLEEVGACSLTEANGFARTPDGRLTHEHDGETDAFWEEAHTVTRRNETIYLTGEGDEVPESQVVVVDSIKNRPEPEHGTEPAERPALADPGRETSFDDVVTLYEVVDPRTGAGHGVFARIEDARREKRRDDLIAAAPYVRAEGGEHPAYVD